LKKKLTILLLIVVSNNNFIKKIQKYDVLERLVYVIEESVSEYNFKLITSEMIKQKILNPCLVFYVQTSSKERYIFLKEKVFQFKSNSDVLPQANSDIEYFLRRKAKNIIKVHHIDDDNPHLVESKKHIYATKASLIYNYE